jgi:hypothetical protein
MSVACDVETRPSAVMGRFERYLTIWVALCIVAGIALGYLFPGLFLQIGRMEMANVNMPVAFLIWLMIIPMLLKVDFTALGQLRDHWRGDRCHLVRQLGGKAVFDDATGRGRLSGYRLWSHGRELSDATSRVREEHWPLDDPA